MHVSSRLIHHPRLYCQRSACPQQGNRALVIRSRSHRHSRESGNPMAGNSSVLRPSENRQVSQPETANNTKTLDSRFRGNDGTAAKLIWLKRNRPVCSTGSFSFHPSFPRTRESRGPIAYNTATGSRALDSRFHGNDGSCVIRTGRLKDPAVLNSLDGG